MAARARAGQGGNVMTAAVAEHCRRIKALSAKLEHAENKVEQYQVAIGQHIAAVKEAEPKDWQVTIEAQCGLKKSRAYELLAIADGRKTVEGVRADTAKRVMKHAKSFPLANGNTDTASTDDVEEESGTSRTAIVPVDDIPSAEEAEESHQETLLDHGCGILERMTVETRQRFFAHIGVPPTENSFPNRVRNAVEAAHFDGEVQEATCKAADKVQRAWAKLSTELWEAYHEALAARATTEGNGADPEASVKATGAKLTALSDDDLDIPPSLRRVAS
jgi:hypothetical protein